MVMLLYDIDLLYFVRSNPINFFANFNIIPMFCEFIMKHARMHVVMVR